MTLADQLRDLATRIQSEVAHASNYYYHTNAVWGLLRQVVNEGRTVAAVNGDTGDRTDGPALVELSEAYLEDYLAESVFQKYVSLFEDYTFGLIGFWLMAYPKGIVGLDDDGNDDRMKRAEKMVPLSYIVDNPDRDSILRVVVDRELDRLKYRRLAAWFEYLDSRARLGIPTKDQIDRLAEMKAARDVIVHNSSVVNSTYLSKAGVAALYVEGDRVEINDPYLRECRLLVTAIVTDTAAAASAKVEKSPAGDDAGPV